MPEDFFGPLPRGSLSDVPVTSGKFYNIEVYGTIFAEGGTISGDFDISGDLTVTGDMDMTGDLTVEGIIDLSGSGKITTDSTATAEFMEILPFAGTGYPLKFWTGESNEKLPASIRAVGGAGSSDFALAGTQVGGVTNYGDGNLTFTGDGVTQEADLNVIGYGNVDADTWLTATTASGDSEILLLSQSTSGTGYITLNSKSGVRVNNSDLLLTESASQNLDKTGSGDFYIRNTVSSAIMYLQASNAGTMRTRIYIDGNGNTDFSDSNGTFRARVSTAGFAVAAGSAGAPSFYNVDDNDTGIYFPTTAQFAITIAGTQEFLLGATGVFIPNVNNDYTGTSDDTVLVDSSGQLHIDTSSLRFKEDWRFVPELADIDLPDPISYLKNGKKRLGLGAEHLEEADERLVTFDDDGEVHNFIDRSLLAVLVAKVNKLEEQMARCNCAV